MVSQGLGQLDLTLRTAEGANRIDLAKCAANRSAPHRLRSSNQ
jgi:hypothetical protein